MSILFVIINCKNRNDWRHLVCHFSLICLCLLATLSLKARETIVVRTQSDFDQLTENLNAAINSVDDDIYVTILPGQYEADENHIKLIEINAPKTRLYIKGHNTIVVPKGKTYRNGEKYEGNFDVENSWMYCEKDVETWSHVRYADGLVEILDPKTKECKIKSFESFPENIDYSNAYILITHWYLSSVYKISKIEGNYIYFVANDLAEKHNKKGYNINDDFHYGHINPRYKLCNVETGDDYLRITNGKVCLPSGIASVREGTTHRYVSITDCIFRGIEVSGIKFLGNKGKKSEAAIFLKNVNCESTRIHKCEFLGFRSNVISFKSSRNVVIENNVFSDCYFSGIRSDNGCEDTNIKGNFFSYMGKRMTNSFCIVCRGTNYLIQENTFVDYGYGGIGVGVWYKSPKKNKCSGIVEHNYLIYSKDYLADIANRTIMDGGAIYLWTKNDGSIIRYNCINNFSGVKSNRGIFCDDGAYNYQLIGNVITGIANSYCIDARRVAKVQEVNTSGTGIDKSNINIVMKDNIVDGKIRFVGNEIVDNGCVMGDIYYLRPENTELPKSIIKNINVVGENVVLNYMGERGGHVGITSKSLRQIKKSSVWDDIKNYIVRKNH